MRKPKGFKPFDELMRKLVKVTPDAPEPPADVSCEWCTSPHRPLHRCGLCGKWFCPTCMETHPCDQLGYDTNGAPLPQRDCADWVE